MSFDQRLKQAASLTEARLSVILAEMASNSPARLSDALRHAVLGGGKRFRPFLVIETAALYGIPAERAVDAAAAMECIHCYSLVHDDLPSMDNDDVRRGRPTVWKAFDEWTAILAGDGLLTLAFEILATRTKIPSDAGASDLQKRVELVGLFARAAGSAGMVGGQALDLEADKLQQPARPTLDHIRRLQAMKTGALITASCEAGAILGGADERQRAALARYGDALGFAFQISDDLLDAEGDAGTVGKATGKDAASGKATLVSLLGINEARQMLTHVEAEAVAALSDFGDTAATLRDAARFVASRRS